MFIAEILSRNARVYPKETALVELSPGEASRRKVTWSSFHRQAGRIAAYLAERDIGYEDRVMLLTRNSLEWFFAFFGVVGTGAIAVPVDCNYGAFELAHCANLTEPRAVFFERSLAWAAQTIAEQFPDRETILVQLDGQERGLPEAVLYSEIMAGNSADSPFFDATCDDTAVLYFTTGSTGRPKAIALTHRNLEFAACLEKIHHEHTHADSFLCMPPLYHCGAFIHWLGLFIVGGKGILLTEVRPTLILKAVSDEKTTVVWLTVPWAKDLVCAIEDGSIDLADYNIGQWRLMHAGAQPIPPSLVKKWKQLLPSVDYNVTYGLTETTGPGCINLGINNDGKIGAIGRPGFDWEARVVDEDLQPLPQGELGRLMLKGPGIMKEYYKNPEATKRVLIDGWLLTSDICRCDEDGYFWLVERAEYIIYHGNHAIYPIEIENFLVLHPKVKDAAVFSLPEKEGVIAALIETKAGFELTDGQLDDFCAVLPPHKKPSVYYWGKVPRTPTGKIQKYLLQQQVGKGQFSPSASKKRQPSANAG